jgi:hypothetical protein
MMNISGTSEALNAGQLMKQVREQKNEQVQAQSQPEPPEVETADIADEQGDTEKARGVIRLLESGHFKGVADVRLRINFFDELSARANANAVPVAQEGAGQLVDTVNGQVDGLLGQLELDEETTAAVETLRGEFDEAVQTAVEESTTDGKVDTTALSESLSSAFAAFSQQLHDLIAPLVAPAAPEEPEIVPEVTDGIEPVETIDEPVVEGDTPVDGETEIPEEVVAEGLTETTEEPVVDAVNPETVEETPEEPTFDLTAAVTTLNDAFSQSLSSFLSSIEEAAALPPLTSEPSGNGKAYEKFLAIYNEMIGQAPAAADAVEQTEETETVADDLDLTV